MSAHSSIPRHSGLLEDRLQDRCPARLGLGARRNALFWAARPRVRLYFGLRTAVCCDEAWLKRGLPCS